MQRTLTSPPIGAADLDTNPPFNVVIAYEDFETGKHAKKTYDFLVENLGRDCQFSNQMWKFDVLSVPKLREIAASDAAGGDIVVISCHGDDLPEHVKRWIEMWLAESGKPLALVALFDRPREEAGKTRTVRDYLAEVAIRGNLEFFAQPDEWPGKKNPSDGLTLEGADDFEDRTLATLAGVVQREFSQPRWSFFD
jgi:hypothetical protein